MTYGYLRVSTEKQVEVNFNTKLMADLKFAQKQLKIWSKKMIDLNKLCEVLLKNADKRHSHGANVDTNTRKMLKHCATEVVEAMESYTRYFEMENIASDIDAKEIDDKWEGEEDPIACEKYYKECKESLASELADIICCCLIIAGKEHIDIENAIKKKKA